MIYLIIALFIWIIILSIVSHIHSKNIDYWIKRIYDNDAKINGMAGKVESLANKLGYKYEEDWTKKEVRKK